MNKDNDLLADMPISSAFFRLAIPAEMFIGRIPSVGKQALAGDDATAPVILAISAFAALVSMGGAPRASIFIDKVYSANGT